MQDRELCKRMRIYVKQRVLSAFLSFTMVLSAIFGSMPPLEVAAAGYEAGAVDF